MSARYAQHFLVDQPAREQIVHSLDLKPHEAVFEIGPGKGALTHLLVQKAQRVVAVEVDSFCLDQLQASLGDQTNFTLIHGDILKFEFESLPPLPKGAFFKVVGNLPYNLTSPILRRLSDWAGWQTGTVMVQKEVGDRLCASVGEKAYGALTVGMNLTCEMERVLDLGPDSFRPRPKVDSTVIRLKKRPQPLTSQIAATQRVIQAAFQQRRKTIVNSLSHGLSLTKEQTKTILKELNISEDIRPERISVHDFVELSKVLSKTL